MTHTSSWGQEPCISCSSTLISESDSLPESDGTWSHSQCGSFPDACGWRLPSFEVVEVLSDVGGQALRFEDAMNLVASHKPHLHHSM